MTVAPFELRFLPDERNRPRLFLLQLPAPTTWVEGVDQPTTVAKLEGANLVTAEPVLKTIVAAAVAQRMSHDNGAVHVLTGDEPGSGLAVLEWAGFPTTIALAEPVAVHIGLLCHGVSSLRSKDRVDEALTAVAVMQPEEVHFWSRVLASAPDADVRRKRFAAYLTGGR